MKAVFVVSLPDIDRKSIIDIALKRTSLNFKVIDFDDILSIKDIGNLKSVTEIRNVIDEFYRKLEKEYIRTMREGYNLIISGYLLKNTNYGILPLISFKFFEMISIDYLILIENINMKKELIELQNKNREFANLCSVLSGSFIKHVKFDESNVLSCINSIVNILRCM